METVRIQKMLGNSKLKEWETILKCREDCFDHTLWMLEKSNPEDEYRRHPLDPKIEQL